MNKRRDRMKKKIKCEFEDQELENIWSALAIYRNVLEDEGQSPITLKEVKKLIIKVRKYLKMF